MKIVKPNTERIIILEGVNIFFLYIYPGYGIARRIFVEALWSPSPVACDTTRGRRLFFFILQMFVVHLSRSFLTIFNLAYVIVGRLLLLNYSITDWDLTIRWLAHTYKPPPKNSLIVNLQASTQEFIVKQFCHNACIRKNYSLSLLCATSFLK